ALFGAVEVGAARREQVELERGVGVAHGIGGAVAAGDDLDAAPAMRLELAEERVLLVGAELVARRMGDHGQTARLRDPAHRVGERRPAVRYEARLAFDEEA